MTESLRVPGFHRFWVVYCVLAVVVCVAIVQVVAAVASVVSAGLLDMQYGKIRTTHIVGALGFRGETPSTPTLVVAVNYGGDLGGVVVSVIPAGNIDAAQTLRMTGDSDPEGVSPPRLELQDVDRDGYPDLVVSLDTGQYAVFLLDTGAQGFRVPTPEENRRIVVR
jgi:hypothetical protein